MKKNPSKRNDMLKGFEDITAELHSYEEELLLPIVVGKLVTHKGGVNAITNAGLRQYIFDRTKKQINEPRVRKIVEYIRQRELLDGLVAGRFGYFVATSPEELEDWIDTMKQRRNAIDTTIECGERSLRKMKGGGKNNYAELLKTNQ